MVLELFNNPLVIEVDPSNNEDYLYWCKSRKNTPRLQDKKLRITIDDNKSILVGGNAGYKSSILHVLDWWFETNTPDSYIIQTIGLRLGYDFQLTDYDETYVQNVYRLIDSYFVDADDTSSVEIPTDWGSLPDNLSKGTYHLLRLIFSAYFPPEKKKCFMLVDDIETNLSVEWQERIIQDICASPYVEGFVVTTHSPFIFSNEFRKYAHGTGRFLQNKE